MHDGDILRIAWETPKPVLELGWYVEDEVMVCLGKIEDVLTNRQDASRRAYK